MSRGDDETYYSYVTRCDGLHDDKSTIAILLQISTNDIYSSIIGFTIAKYNTKLMMEVGMIRIFEDILENLRRLHAITSGAYIKQRKHAKVECFVRFRCQFTLERS
jgi:hypothetical protein